MKTCFAVVVALSSSLMFAASAQDAKTVLDNAAKAMNAETLKSIEYSGAGFAFVLGQAPNPSSPWPKFNAKSYDRVIDFDAGLSRQRLVRTQFENPPHGGGNQPIVGELTGTQIVSSTQPWADQFEIWITPVGFLKGAIANSATVQSKTIGGKKYNVVSFNAQGKYKVTGYIDDQNMVDKVETIAANPVLGDMPVEADYSEYKDFGGLKFPSKIVEKQGGYPVLDLTITDAKRDVAANIKPPEEPRITVTSTMIAPDVYFLTGGSHNSVAVGFNDYVVMIEGPLNEARSEAVIAKTKELFPNKPIRYLVNTHHHFDHSGGIRTYAAEGATILTYQLNKPYYEKTFKMPRTQEPDRLAQSKGKAKIEAVGEKRVLTDGTHTVELYHLQNAGHNDGMLIAFLTKEKILVEADSFTAAGPPNAPAPSTISPYTTALVDNLERLKLDYEIVLGLHGRRSDKAELMKAAGKSASATARVTALRAY